MVSFLVLVAQEAAAADISQLVNFVEALAGWSSLSPDVGMVAYHLGNRSVSHQEYVRSVLGKPFASHYPGFSSDPIDAFHNLLLDLQQHASDFLEGPDEQLAKRIADARAIPAFQSGLPR
jgi:hypothetical protein